MSTKVFFSLVIAAMLIHFLRVFVEGFLAELGEKSFFNDKE